jgi:uncharacterized protein (DUF362 family)
MGAGEMTTVVVDAKAEKLSPVEAGFEALRRLGFKTDKGEAFIKPNVCYPSGRGRGIVTDPEVVRGIIRYFRGELGIERITVGESVYDEAGCLVQKYFARCGYVKMAKEERVKLVDLNESERVGVPWKYGSISLPSIIFDKSVCYVNVAKMKTHDQTTWTLCKKNQKGLIDNGSKKMFHKLGLFEPIEELARLVRPDLCVVDGIVGLEGQGAGVRGKARNFGKVVAGFDIEEVDSKCIELMMSSNWKLPRPQEYSFFGIQVHACKACTACVHSLLDLERLLLKSPGAIWFFFKHGILGRMEIFLGNPANRSEVQEPECFSLFFGNCSKDFADKHPEYLFVPGCPPVPKDALKKIIGDLNENTTP